MTAEKSGHPALIPRPSSPAAWSVRWPHTQPQLARSRLTLSLTALLLVSTRLSIPFATPWLLIKGGARGWGRHRYAVL